MRLLLLARKCAEGKVTGRGAMGRREGSQDENKKEFGSTNKNNKQLLVI